MWPYQISPTPSDPSHSERMSTVSSYSDLQPQNLMKVKISHANKHPLNILQDPIPSRTGYPSTTKSTTLGAYKGLTKSSFGTSALDKLMKFEKKYSKVDTSNKIEKDVLESENKIQKKVIRSEHISSPKFNTSDPVILDMKKLDELTSYTNNDTEYITDKSTCSTMRNIKMASSSDKLKSEDLMRHKNIKIEPHLNNLTLKNNNYHYNTQTVRETMKIDQDISNDDYYKYLDLNNVYDGSNAVTSPDIKTSEVKIYENTSNVDYNKYLDLKNMDVAGDDVTPSDIRTSEIPSDTSIEMAEDLTDKSIESVPYNLSNIKLVSVPHSNEDDTKSMDLSVNSFPEKQQLKSVNSKKQISSKTSDSTPKEYSSHEKKVAKDDKPADQNPKSSQKNTDSPYKDASHKSSIIEEDLSFKNTSESGEFPISPSLKNSPTQKSREHFTKENKELLTSKYLKTTSKTMTRINDFKRQENVNHKRLDMDINSKTDRQIISSNSMETVLRNKRTSDNTSLGDGQSSNTLEATIKPFSTFHHKIHTIEDLFSDEMKDEDNAVSVVEDNIDNKSRVISQRQESGKKIHDTKQLNKVILSDVQSTNGNIDSEIDEEIEGDIPESFSVTSKDSLKQDVSKNRDKTLARDSENETKSDQLSAVENRKDKNALSTKKHLKSKGQMKQNTHSDMRGSYCNVAVQTDSPQSVTTSESSVPNEPDLKPTNIPEYLKSGTSEKMLDPYPIIRYSLEPEVIEAMVAQKPMETALHEMVKLQIDLTKHFMSAQYNMYEAYTNSVRQLTANYKPVTLEDTKKFIKKHRRSKQLGPKM